LYGKWPGKSNCFQKRGEKGIRVGQRIGVPDGFSSAEPKDFVDFVWVGGQDGRAQVGKPAPKGQVALGRPVMPDALDGNDYGVEFFPHFPYEGGFLIFPGIDAATRETDL
jgi:hypothetical protein